MGKPDFICIGPGRTGTSWLREMLDSHPSISLAKIKETEYFNNNEYKGLKWYESHFSNDQSKISGEISNMYYLDQAVPDKIFQSYPDIKIIACTREVGSLIQSFYQFGLRRGVAAISLQDALSEPIAKYMGSGYQERLKEGRLSSGDEVTVLDAIRLEYWITPYLQKFGCQNILLLPYESLKNDGPGTLKKVYSFLGVDVSHKPGALFEVVNPGLEPKNKTVALIAHKSAFFLRKLGFNRVLTELHKSRWIKYLLFREVSSKDSVEVLDVDPLILKELERENEKISQLYHGAWQ